MKQLVKRLLGLPLLALGLLLPVACDDDAPAPATNQPKEVNTYNVAVIMPGGNGNTQWKQMADWALLNMERAQEGRESQVRLKVEWYDESTEDLQALGAKLAARSDLSAIVGPYESDHVRTLGYACARYKKTLIAPTASSVELMRIFSNEGFLWALTENDISQCEVLLSRCAAMNVTRVSLLAADGIYGQSFVDWFAFQATEMSLVPEHVITYTNAAERDEAIEYLMSDNVTDALVCVPSGTDDVLAILECQNRHSGACPRLLFSDVAFSDDIIQQAGFLCEQMEGVAPCTMPESGFNEAHTVYFGTRPQTGKAHFYDAFMLLSLAAAQCAHTGTTDFNAALHTLTEGRGEPINAWDEGGMRRMFSAIASDNDDYDLQGASGLLDFDEKIRTNVLHSTYANWWVFGGRFLIQAYLSSDGSRRSSPTLASWNWQCRQYDEWGSYTADIQYEPLKERYALLVAASEGWTNYRHQADVLNMYHLLKARGYNDDHIVLIVADDLAQNAENPVPGEVKTAADGPNLYEGIQIDYRLADLQPADIGHILNGERSERLPHVIGATTADNVLVFWSGHGLPGYFCWGAERHGFSTDDFTALMHDMSEGKKFRKLLWVAETCYSASVLKGYDQTPSVLCLAAANENEPSHADVYDLQLHAFRSNRFTLTLTSAIKETPDITLNQLFYRVTRQTTGSHVKMFGEETFDNLNLATAKEFF